MTTNKLHIRPVIKGVVISGNMSQEEKFQNNTLRPVLKLQHELIMAFFENHMLRKKIQLSELSSLKKEKIIEDTFASDNRFKSEIRGMVLGLFTVSEFKEYLVMSNEINKRMMTMLKERIHSTL